MDISAIQQQLRAFSAERDWDQFHNPKNLAMALSVEAAELVELYQWLTPEQAEAASHDPAFATRLGEELADILLYLLRLADRTGIDLPAAVARKQQLNAQKYPADAVQGQAKSALNSGQHHSST
ncbi:nucleotide pyrophosphohydrolase [Chitinilyticum piscinae]|uniref:Nucleotide pyrophosphohydrolase n=1 Tax=Chitinilyticum piscinae TaxID=2866724 RepID=A0A8J7KBF3_9NEIS|nr:nucleotide pyrophosphohydrolase [Chitinilyticum piscinae]MBE9610174.1 nucleotide pyrophosphohydrolase [Chitinilyticum piscinae]